MPLYVLHDQASFSELAANSVFQNPALTSQIATYLSEQCRAPPDQENAQKFPVVSSTEYKPINNSPS